MKKYILIAFLIPSIAFAAWWNPLTWNWNPLSWIGGENAVSYSDVPTPSSSLAAVVIVTTANATSIPKIGNASQSKKVNPPPVVSVPLIVATTPQPTAPTPAPVPPPNTTLCNGTYYTACSTGQNFVCPSSGAAYCELPPQQSAPPQITNDSQQELAAQAAQQAAQQRTDQINTLTQQYNSQKLALDQEIVNIKTKYYSDAAALQSQGGGMEFLQGETQKLANDANTQIAQIELQENQLLISYQSQLNALQ